MIFEDQRGAKDVGSSAPDIRILSLCSGIGGLDLGVSSALRLLGFNPITVCYVEIEAYAAAVLAARMGEGRLDKAPVWSDIKTFEAEAWRGSVDLILGGYPCQPFSLAGKRRGKEDPRHLWPHVLRLLVESGAALLFVENVRGHVSKGLREVLGNLSCFGFDAEWDCYSAEEEGAAHRRERVFLFAYRNSSKLWVEQGGRIRKDWERKAESRSVGQDWPTSYADSQAKLQPKRFVEEVRRRTVRRLEEDANHDAPGFSNPGAIEFEKELTLSQRGSWWCSEPPLVRGVHGVPNRMDRIRALGNAVVPACARRAFLELWGRSAIDQ